MVKVQDIELAQYQFRKVKVTICSSYYDMQASNVFPVTFKSGSIDAMSIDRITDWIMSYCREEWPDEQIELSNIAMQLILK